MKILMLCDFYGIGQTYQDNLLAKYYIKMGHSVVVVTSTYNSPFDYNADKLDKSLGNSKELDNDIVIYRRRYSLNILHKLRRYDDISEIIASEKPDLIYAHDIHLNLPEVVRYIKKNFSVRLIMDYHCDYSNSAKNWISLKVLHGVIRKSFFLYYKKHIEKIYSIVPDGAKFLHEVYGVNYSEIELLPLGCDYDLSVKLMKGYNRHKLRKTLNIPEDKFVVFTGGKLNKLKRTDVLIESVKRLSNKSVLLLIVGEVPQEEKEYDLYLHELAKESETRFVGWCDAIEMMKYMMISDLAVFPASQSVLWQQCIGMHLPLVVGDSGNQDATYLNYSNNVINLSVDEINVDTFVKIIDRLAGNPDEISEMRAGASRAAAEYLSYGVIAKKTLEIFN